MGVLSRALVFHFLILFSSDFFSRTVCGMAKIFLNAVLVALAWALLGEGGPPVPVAPPAEPQPEETPVLAVRMCNYPQRWRGLCQNEVLVGSTTTDVGANFNMVP